MRWSGWRRRRGGLRHWWGMGGWNRALVGYAEMNTASAGRPLHNAVAVVRDGRLVAKRFKSLLPTYDVFDESRYFEPGPDTELTFIGGPVLEGNSVPVGVSICEDLWND